MDLNDLAKMTDSEFQAWFLDDSNIDPERKAPRAKFAVNANTWNCIARDLLAYAFARSGEYAVTGAANEIFEATADMDWDEQVIINLRAHPVVIEIATNRGARNA